MGNTAYFVRRPRKLKDLFALHAVDQEKMYEIVKIIRLSSIDYGNFISDMTVDRRFLEENSVLCSSESIWKCLLICGEKTRGGILVIPLDGRWVGWAAFLREAEK